MSLTIRGVFISAIALVLQQTGTPFIQGDIETAVNVVLALAGLLVTYYGRLRQGDVSFFGGKR